MGRKVYGVCAICNKNVANLGHNDIIILRHFPFSKLNDTYYDHLPVLKVENK